MKMKKKEVNGDEELILFKLVKNMSQQPTSLILKLYYPKVKEASRFSILHPFLKELFVFMLQKNKDKRRLL